MGDVNVSAGRFDHLQHWVPDLDAAIAAYERAGFPIRLGGRHPGQGTHNAQWETAPHFIELIAVHDRAEAASGWRTAWSQIANILEGGGGAGRFAVEVDDLVSLVQRVRAAGFDIRDPLTGSIAHPDGAVGTWSLAPLRGAPPWAPFFTNYGATPSERARGRQREESRWHLRTLGVATPSPVSSAQWLARVLGMPIEAEPRVQLGDVTFEFTYGESDRIVEIGLSGDPPECELFGLRYRRA